MIISESEIGEHPKPLYILGNGTYTEITHQSYNKIIFYELSNNISKNHFSTNNLKKKTVA